MDRLLRVILRLLTLLSALLLALAACNAPAATLTPAPEVGADNEFGGLPLHIMSVEPADGETIGDDYSVCVYFDLQAGGGLGADPEKAMRLLVDGEEPSSRAVGWDTDEDASRGSLCIPPRRKDPSGFVAVGWHIGLRDLEIRYQDAAGVEYSYGWQIQVGTEAPAMQP